MEGDSLLMYMPLQIAYRMEKKTADELVRQMLERFETPYGLATENPRSEYYKTGGYWLGPVWAPVMYLMIDALRDNGYAVSYTHLDVYKRQDLRYPGRLYHALPLL